MNKETLKKLTNIDTGMSSNEIQQFINFHMPKEPDSIPARHEAVNAVIRAMYDQVREKNGPVHEAVQKEVGKLTARLSMKIDPEDSQMTSAAFSRILLGFCLDAGAPEWFDPAILTFKGELVVSVIEQHVWEGLGTLFFMDEDRGEWLRKNFVPLGAPSRSPTVAGSMSAFLHMTNNLYEELVAKEMQAWPSSGGEFS